ncbi:MAG: phosphoribosylformylglycinamidine synthase subunit PurQ [Verrucomicrobiae bacterium]|nr:phosphoribosylformylglycinamidine synthase subunit PurQ [Verrucomicrobiae bacterium]
MKIGIVQFPGSTCDRDVFEVLTRELGAHADYLWYDISECRNYDLIVLPGGFSYGDSLRPGAIAATTPIMSGIKKFAESGGLILGICNGFQILCECQLLPGILRKNQQGKFICHEAKIKVEKNRSYFMNFLSVGDVLDLSIAHAAGCYWVEEKTLRSLKEKEQIVFRYCDALGNGSVNQIAGVCNEKGNVVGMMPHPERTLGFPDGLRFWKNLVTQVLESKL